MAKAVYGRDDVCVKVLVVDGGGDVTVPVDDSEGAARVQVDEGGGMVKAVNGEGDICAKVPVDEGRDDLTVTVDDSGDAARVQAEEGSDMAKDIDCGSVGPNAVHFH